MSNKDENQNKSQANLMDNSKGKGQSDEKPNIDIKPPQYTYVTKTAKANSLQKIVKDEINKGDK